MSKKSGENCEKAHVSRKKMSHTDIAAAVAAVVCIFFVCAIWFVMPSALERAKVNFSPIAGMIFGLIINPVAYFSGGFCAAYVLQKWLKIDLSKMAKRTILIILAICVIAVLILFCVSFIKFVEMTLKYQAFFVVLGILAQLSSGKIRD